MNTVAFPSGKIAHQFLLIRTLKIKSANVSTRGCLVFADLNDLVAFRDFLPNCFFIRQAVPTLIDVTKMNRFPQVHGAHIRGFFTANHAEEGRLARTITAYDANDGSLGHRKRKLGEEQSIVECFGYPVNLEHFVPKARAWRNIDFLGFVSGLELLRIQLIKAREARPVLGLARLWLGSHPFQFCLNRFLASRLLSLLDLQALLLRFKPSGIVALVRNAVSSVEFEDPACSIVQEVAIVGDGDHRAWKLL